MQVAGAGALEIQAVEQVEQGVPGAAVQVALLLDILVVQG
jgi:hypothetical protein